MNFTLIMKDIFIHIGYSIDKELNDEEMQEKMLQLVREYITASAFPQ